MTNRKPVRLPTPRIRVILLGAEDKPLDVQAINADMIRWDETRFKHKWPPMAEAQMLWVTFIAWAAAVRGGAIPVDFTWERWKVEALSVQALDDDDDETGSPTPPGVDPG